MYLMRKIPVTVRLLLYYLRKIKYNDNATRFDCAMREIIAMYEFLLQYLDESKTAYQAHDNAVRYLQNNGFTELKENEVWKLARGDKRYVSRDGSALIAFRIGDKDGFSVVASHDDSPAFKLKGTGEIEIGNMNKFNVEKYGGGIFYSWLDTPVTVAGRVILSSGDKLEARSFVSKYTFVIPSVAIHFNRAANDGIKLNPQVDMSPLTGILSSSGLKEEIEEFAAGKEFIEGDLFIVSAQKPFVCGYRNELLSSPRIDNLTSVCSSLEALCKAEPTAISVCYIADNEEVGSRTKQGAGSRFLPDTLYRIHRALGGNEESFDVALANTFFLSCDNAHAMHPNHPELSDPTNKTLLGKGIVIKHHANQNYTSDAFSSAIAKNVFSKANAAYQDFYMRSDLPCGGTLGAISSSQVSVRSADIGIAQLAMHSAVETMALCDYDEMIKGLTAFYGTSFRADGSSVTELIR